MDERELEARIRRARRASLDGTRVVYDLTTGMDFSKPRRAAEAIADVLWNEDVKAWWSVASGTATCRPTHSVQILVPEEHHRKIMKTVDEFKRDLVRQGFAEDFHWYIELLGDREVDWPTIFILGPLGAYLMERWANRERRLDELDRVFSEMAKAITVSPQGT